MKVIEDKIKQEISNGKRLRNIAKDEEIGFRKSMELYEAVISNSKKIKFLKGLNAAFKKLETQKRK